MNEISDKQAKMTQKERKRIEIQKRKFQLEQERETKPGECNKFIKVIIEKEIVEKISGEKIVDKLKELHINVAISSSVTPHTITFQRRLTKKMITDDGSIVEFDEELKDEPYLVVILTADVFINATKENRLLGIVQAAQELCPVVPVSTTLVVYGLKSYCKKRKNTITIKETEIKLTQLQILANCSHRLHENPDDMALTVAQIARSIAEEPFKSKQNQKLDQEQLYLTSDIKVNASENDTDSLARLWHTQLLCLPKVTFDVAQSITKEYAMPRKLIEAYMKCDNKNQLLQDIPIIKTGPLSKSRRIGPELSRKIATLMISKNSNDLL